MSLQPVQFSNADGQKLDARLHIPDDGSPVGFAIFAHCFTCTKNLRAIGHISKELAQRGIAVLRFDFTGLGESEGEFEETGFQTNVSDLVAAGEFLEEQYGAPSILVGHSLGGAAVLRAAARMSSVTAVATINAPASPDHVLRHLTGALDEIEREGRAEVDIGGRPFTIGQRFIEDIRDAEMQEAIGNLGRALLVFHSPVDTIVGVDNARRIFDAAKHPKSFVGLDGADHLLTDSADALFCAQMLAAWARRYVATPETLDVPAVDARGSVTARIGREHYRTEIAAREHRLVADEPGDVGGGDRGPTPYDLLLAGLGACTAMTLRMYADRKEWSLDSVTVRLQHGRVHARDCHECESKEGKIDRIERELSLEGDLDEDQRRRLVEIAERCPVHRTLDSETVIVTSRGAEEEDDG